MGIQMISDQITSIRITTLVSIALILLDFSYFAASTKFKRQLFREHLLPEKGGKIPESAFHPERLALNRLSQQGIAIPDGVALEPRRPERYPFPKSAFPNTLKVVLMNDGRYVAPPGRIHYDKQPTVDTTYVIRPPHKPFHKGSQENSQVSQLIPHWHANPNRHLNKVIKGQPPVWYNEILNTKWKTKPINQDYTDPAQVLIEYKSYLDKLHRDYDK